MHAEEWRAVAGYEGSYEVSNHGRVRSLDRMVNNRGKLKLRPARVLAAFSSSGYKQVALYLAGVKVTLGVHVLVAKAFCVGGVGPVVNHKDNNPANNHYSNLELTTYKGNTAHAIQLGNMHASTNANKRRKLSLEAVQSIPKLYSELGTKERVGQVLGVSGAMISYILSGKSWALPPEHSLPDTTLAP